MRTSFHLKTLAAAGLLLATVSAGLAQTAAKPAPGPKPARMTPATPPPPGPAREVRFPAFQQKTLDNGLLVVAIEQHEQPLV
ncbi:MAG TPA: hypothetical protein VLR69_14585, partial [Thermoanaerobaculia bacterium]|nr:hypothetical protein [Thermoanaerobaculia bacterium]